MLFLQGNGAIFYIKIRPLGVNLGSVHRASSGKYAKIV